MKTKTLDIYCGLLSNGIFIKVLGKKYKIEYPDYIWKKTPLIIRQALLENLTYAYTCYLPLILNKNSIKYHDIPLPIFEPALFKNFLFDLLDCEKSDGVKHLSYLKQFYNLEYEYTNQPSAQSFFYDDKKFKHKTDTAIVPFSFGKESLTTFALCRELGIRPILVYCQEPTHQYEEKFKVKKLAEIKKEFGVETYFIKNQAALFRYGKAFHKKNGTELGWGAETTTHALLMIPFVYVYRAQYIFFGNEYLNNRFNLIDGWKAPVAYDHTKLWTVQQNNIIMTLTNGQCQVRSMLEPLEEITIQYILYNRYNDLVKYHSSCFAKRPYLVGSHWCHKCYKCEKMFLLGAACGIDYKRMGFKYKLWENNDFMKEYLGGYFDKDSDFAFSILHKQKMLGKYDKSFSQKKLKNIDSFNKLQKFFLTVKVAQNLPNKYQHKLYNIFNQEINKLKKLLVL